MAIASTTAPRHDRGRARPIRALAALALAAAILAPGSSPALAMDTAARPMAGATPAADPIPSGDPAVSAEATATPDPSPSPSPSADPAPSAALSADPTPSTAPSASPDPTPTPSVDPTPSPSPTTDPSPSPTPDPSPTPSPSPTPTPWPTNQWPTTVTTLGDTVKFFGQGYGHGVGMNQHGAKGRAEQGQTAEEILKAYFHGATMSTVNPDKPVRVLLLYKVKATSTAPLVIYGRGGTWGLTGTDEVFPADAQLKVWRVSGQPWKVKVRSAGGDTLYRASVSGKPYVTSLEAATSLQLYSKPSVYDTYRGSLRLLLASTKRKVSVVNHLGLDDYLRGVAPVEMPASWAREAVRAQVIASRSYAVKSRHPDRGNWDMYDDTRSQVYRGTKAEKGVTNTLIRDEPGAVIRYKGDKVIKAFYFSTGGGATENNEYVFVSSSGTPGTSKVPYLRGILDRSEYGIPFDKDAPLYSWKTTRLPTSTLSSMFRKDSRTNVGTLTRLDLRRRGVSGRLYQVVLHGSSGKKTVSADVFRSVYNRYKPSSAKMLRSNLFDTKPIAGA